MLVVYAVGLALATFVEKYHGTEAAKAMIYYSPVFILLQFLLIVNFLAAVRHHALIRQRKWGMILLHSSFVVILAGAMTSHLFSEEGILHIRQGETTDRVAVRTAKETTWHTLPFQVELVKFTLTRYPGSSSPSSYESELLIHVDGTTRKERVYMNNVLDIKGYRLFQASYDKDEQGTILSVNKDVAGRTITYGGYLLMALGFLFALFDKHGRFRFLSRRLKELRKAAAVLLVILSSLSLHAVAPATSPVLDAIERHAVPADHAAKFGALPIQLPNGRMVPVNTFASEILRKLHKSPTIGTLNADQFLVSLLALPDMWMRVPFIALPNEDVASFFSLSKDECAYIEMFTDEGGYKLQERLEEAYNRMPVQRTKFDKDLFKLDEQVNILHQLFNHQLLNLFPDANDPNHTWYAQGDDLSVFTGQDSLFVSRIMEWYVGEVRASMQSGNWTKPDEIIDMIHTYQDKKNKTLDISPKRIETELKYNRMDVFRWCKIGYLILGGLLLILAFAGLFNPRKWIKYVVWLLGIGVLVVFHYHMLGMGMRWYIAGYAPWSNSYETMVYVAWATVFAGLMFVRKSTITFALATLFSGIILFVSGLSWMDPQINPLVPVLKSPWLMFHVSVIMAAYGFFGICCLIGLTNLVMISCSSANNKVMLDRRIEELSIVNEMAMIVGLGLMTIGTFLGAVWANESWGRYWGWDPKETWALITLVAYAITLHLRLVKKWDDPWLFNLMSVLSFATVLMTYFGVNYFLSGMHSYGQNDDVSGIFTYLYIAAAVIAALAVVSRLKYHKQS